MKAIQFIVRLGSSWRFPPYSDRYCYDQLQPSNHFQRKEKGHQLPGAVPHIFFHKVTQCIHQDLNPFNSGSQEPNM